MPVLYLEGDRTGQIGRNETAQATATARGCPKTLVSIPVTLKKLQTSDREFRALFLFCRDMTRLSASKWTAPTTISLKIAENNTDIERDRPAY